MMLKSRKLSLMGIALLLVGVFSCKDDFTEEDLINKQNQAKLDEIKQISASDSLAYLLALEELEYRKYLDSLSRADSIAIAAGQQVYLPYTYNLSVINASEMSATNGRSKAFASDVTVTIVQYGNRQQQTSRDGLFTFSNLGVGTIHGSITATGFTTFEFVVDASLPYQLFKEVVQVTNGVSGGTGGALGGQGGSASPNSVYLENAYYLDVLLKYFNQRSFGNNFPIFATSGTNTSTVRGRVFAEFNTTNRTKEVVSGAQIAAHIDVDDGNFTSRYVLDGNTGGDPTNDYDPSQNMNAIFQPTSWAIGYLGVATSNAQGDYTLTLPSSPDGSVPIRFEVSDVIADKTFYQETNGDVTTITRRNIYGQNISPSSLPFIFNAPTVTFEAGGGAEATAKVSGDGSITDIDVTASGANYQGTPRVWIAPPSTATGVQATATAVVANGKVTDITIVNGGSGYTTTPNITITEGAGGAATVNQLAINAENGGVANVVVTNSGVNYAVAPNVVFYADLNGSLSYNLGEELTSTNFPTGVNSGGFQSGTSFPAGAAVFNTDNLTCRCVSTVNVTASGSAMNFAPRVEITSGTGASGTVTIAGGVVTVVNVTTGGRYYTSLPTLSLSPAPVGTTQPVLTPVLTAGVLTSVTITNAGAGLADGAYSLVVTPVGSGATGTVVWQGNGIGGVSISNVGTSQADGKFYTNVPAVVFPEPTFKGTGSRRATGVAKLGQDGRLIGIDITDEGMGYSGSLASMAPTILSGSGAAANAYFANYGLTEIEVDTQGSGYIVAPTVLIVDPNKQGTGATAVAKLTNGRVTSIDVTNAGTGYISVPTVIILDPGTSFNPNNSSVYSNQAGANVVVTNGVVTAVEVYQRGDNYPAGTEVRVSALKGSGFTATTTVAAGKITAVTVTAGGAGYVGNNYARPIDNSVDPNVAGGYTSDYSFFASPDLTNQGGDMDGTYYAKSGVSRVMDLDLGTGADKD